MIFKYHRSNISCKWKYFILKHIKSLPPNLTQFIKAAVAHNILYYLFSGNTLHHLRTVNIESSVESDMSFMKSKNNNGPSIDPCGTSDVTGTHSDVEL